MKNVYNNIVLQAIDKTPITSKRTLSKNSHKERYFNKKLLKEYGF